MGFSSLILLAMFSWCPQAFWTLQFLSSFPWEFLIDPFYCLFNSIHLPLPVNQIWNQWCEYKKPNIFPHWVYNLYRQTNSYWINVKQICDLQVLDEIINVILRLCNIVFDLRSWEINKWLLIEFFKWLFQIVQDVMLRYCCENILIIVPQRMWNVNRRKRTKWEASTILSDTKKHLCED